MTEKLLTAREQLEEELWEFGYELEVCGFTDAEGCRVLEISKRLKDRYFVGLGYEGYGPCYEMIHDYLKDCSIDDAVGAIRANYDNFDSEEDVPEHLRRSW